MAADTSTPQTTSVTLRHVVNQSAVMQPLIEVCYCADSITRDGACTVRQTVIRAAVLVIRDARAAAGRKMHNSSMKRWNGDKEVPVLNGEERPAARPESAGWSE